MNEKAKKPKIARTSSGLRDALFEAIEQVRDGDMTAETGKTIAGLAKEICSTVDLEIEVAKLRTNYPADTKLVLPGTLMLGNDGKEK